MFLYLKAGEVWFSSCYMISQSVVTFSILNEEPIQTSQAPFTRHTLVVIIRCIRKTQKSICGTWTAGRQVRGPDDGAGHSFLSELWIKMPQISRTSLKEVKTTTTVSRHLSVGNTNKSYCYCMGQFRVRTIAWIGPWKGLFFVSVVPTSISKPFMDCC